MIHLESFRYQDYVIYLATIHCDKCSASTKERVSIVGSIELGLNELRYRSGFVERRPPCVARDGTVGDLRIEDLCADCAATESRR